MSWYDPTSWDWGALNPLEWGKKSEEELRAGSTFTDRDQLMNIINQGLGTAGSRPAPTASAVNSNAAHIATGPQGQFRDMQMQQANALMGQALGTQKGPGQLAAQQATARGVAGQMGVMGSARGSNAGIMGLNAARNAADIGQAGIAQQAQAGLQDKAQANALLSQALGQGRGQDLSLATGQAGLQQQTNLANQAAQNQVNLANLQSQLQQTGMNDAQINAYLSALLGMNQAELAAYTAASSGNTGYLGGLMQVGGQVLGSYLGRPQAPSGGG